MPGVPVATTGIQSVLVAQYCNGSRVPPEAGARTNGNTVACVCQVPPGTNGPGALPGVQPEAGRRWTRATTGSTSVGSAVVDESRHRREARQRRNNVQLACSHCRDLCCPGRCATALSTDFFGNVRTGRYSIGAVQPGAAATATRGQRIAGYASLRQSGDRYHNHADRHGEQYRQYCSGWWRLHCERLSLLTAWRSGGRNVRCHSGRRRFVQHQRGVQPEFDYKLHRDACGFLHRRHGHWFTGGPERDGREHGGHAGVARVRERSGRHGQLTAHLDGPEFHWKAARSLSVTFSGPFAAAAGGTCGTSLNNNASCTINVAYNGTAAAGTSLTGTVAITTNGGFTVANSPVQLTGTAVTPVVAANLAPTIWSPQQTRNRPGTGAAGRAACAADPTQVFTLTNAGNVNLTGVTQGSLAGANTADYAIVAASSTCGTAGFTTLAPNATCTVTLQFKPLTSEAAGVKNATLTVGYTGGSQSSTLAGMAQ